MAYQDEQSQKYSIPTFVGYRQSVDESQMNPGETNDAQNYIVNEGVLEVTKGYTKYTNQTVPGGIQVSFLTRFVELTKNFLLHLLYLCLDWLGLLKEGLTSL